MARETLSRDQIVTAAVGLLDAEGLEGMNMRALGRRLGSAATAVYWHVGSRQSLIALAADRAWAEVELPDPAGVGWRTAAYLMAASEYAMLTRHPWLVQAFGSYQLYGPGKARHDDHSLAVYEAAGFVGAEADQATSAVFTFVLGNALGLAATASFTRTLGRDGDVQALLRANRAEVVQVAAQFPRLRARLKLPSAGYGAAPEGSFAFGLQALLDGLEARLERADA
jgi:AcrR family transcriptional regulator